MIETSVSTIVGGILGITAIGLTIEHLFFRFLNYLDNKKKEVY